MNLLKTSDRTVGQLESHLRLDGYPGETIEQALSYVASFHYTDDMRWCTELYPPDGRKKERQTD